MISQLGFAVPSAASTYVVTSLTDEELVKRFVAGERVVVEELFGRYRYLAARVAYLILGDEADAQDAVQAGLLNAWKGLREFKGKSSFKTWLMRIVTRSALSLCRQRAVRQDQNRGTRFAEVQYARTHQSRALVAIPDRLADSELHEVIRRTMRVYATERMLLVERMRYEGLNFQQIADELDVGVETVRKEMQKVKKLLREGLSRHGWSTS